VFQKLKLHHKSLSTIKNELLEWILYAFEANMK